VTDTLTARSRAGSPAVRPVRLNVPMRAVPAPIADRIEQDLGHLDPFRKEEFTLRVRRWWPDIVDGLTTLYGGTHDLIDLAAGLIGSAARAYADRDPDLLTLDRARLLTPDWLQRPDMVGYAAYADRFARNLAGVGEHLDYLAELGVTYVHLMPLLRPREGDNDGGYAVASYREVRPDLGTTEDLRVLASALRGRGMSLVVDLVLNHVAREHEWAQRAREGDAAYRDYFYVFPDRTLPDAYEETLPEVFPDFAPGSFTWDDDLAGWVWTTFNRWQWDVNWSNPRVLAEFVDIILFLTNLGVEVLRLDAIAFTWKRMGTTCQNQPEVHDLTQVLRSIARLACPGVAFKAEAIVGPRDLIQYLGTGRHVGQVSDLAYHNSLMVQVWSMVAAGDTVLARRALRNLPATPTTGTWITYARCHDDIGWAIDDRDAEAVGLNGFWHRRFLADWYAGDVAGSWARGLVFQFNEETGDKRTSGSAASLAGLEAAATQEAKDQALARIFLIHAIAFGWGGVPVIWSGDELATLNDPHWAGETGHEDDNRWAHRPRLDWERATQRDDLRTETGKVFHGMSHLAAVRKSLPQLHASSDPEVLDDGIDRGIFAVARRHASGPMLGLYNVTQDWRPFPWSVVERMGFTQPVNALGNRHSIASGDDGYVWLSPFSAWWVVDA
jgi:amylosucrase